MQLACRMRYASAPPRPERASRGFFMPVEGERFESALVFRVFQTMLDVSAVLIYTNHSRLGASIGRSAAFFISTHAGSHSRRDAPG